MVLAGGTSARKLNLDAFIRQAGEYEEWDSGLGQAQPADATSSS